MSSPAVVDSVLKRVSPSQIKSFSPTWEGCPMSWWLSRVHMLPGKGHTKATETGEKVHSQIEHYLRTGENVLGVIALPALKFIPKPSPNYVIERTQILPFLETAAGTVNLEFRADLLIAPEHGESGHPEVWDWKTTRNLAKYAKTTEQLVTDVQMATEGWWWANEHKSDRAQLAHVTMQTEGKKDAVNPRVVVPLDVLEQTVITVKSAVTEMVDVAREKDPKKVPYNTKACSAYGGCPYQDICPHSPAGEFKALVTGDKYMGLLDRLNDTAPAAAPAPVEEPAAIVPPDAPVQAAPKARKKRLDAVQEVLSAGLVPPVSSTVVAGSVVDPEALVLYVDCVPREFHPAHLNKYVSDLAAELAAKFNCLDVRTAANDTPIGYGKWKAALAAMARANPPKGRVFVRSTDELAGPVIEALEPLAKEVIRGV